MELEILLEILWLFYSLIFYVKIYKILPKIKIYPKNRKIFFLGTHFKSQIKNKIGQTSKNGQFENHE